MAKALPLKLWLELEDSVAAHKAAIAQNFAEARARLLPDAECRPWCTCPRCMRLWTAEELAAVQWNPLAASMWRSHDRMAGL